MNKTFKIIGIVVCILLVGFLAWFATARYLVSRLDGSHAPTPTMQQYSSEDGVTFQYPDTYILSSKNNDVAGMKWDSLELVDKSYVPPENGEGPESISMSVFQNDKNLSLKDFIKTDPRLNYKLSRDGTFTHGTIGGEPSLAYQFSGLYEHDAVAVLHRDKVFFFTASWSQTIEPIRQDFSKLLASVTFN